MSQCDHWSIALRKRIGCSEELTPEIPFNSPSLVGCASISMSLV